MATKSFTSEFKFNQKSSSKLANAIENSRRVDHQIKSTVNDVVRPDVIEEIIKDFSGDK